LNYIKNFTYFAGKFRKDMNIAVILAGGTGIRLGTETPKQFLKISGKMIIEHTLNVFEQHPFIDEIAIVINKHYQAEMEKMVLNGGYEKVQKIIAGGKERHDSSRAAIRAYEDRPQVNLLIHDAVRPMIDAKTISEVIHALEKYNAITVAIPVTDTIYQVEHNLIQEIPDRKKMMRAQTPQAFKQHILQKAYQLAFENKDFTATDDCGIIAKYLPDEPVFVVAGTENNLKITHKEDIFLLEKIIEGV
jgi:2-C-methyl-D-erythritol 4-phosphate cytidylyltransferase